MKSGIDKNNDSNLFDLSNLYLSHAFKNFKLKSRVKHKSDIIVMHEDKQIKMLRFDIDEQDEVELEMLTCEQHGDFPAALKSYGCPECQAELLDDDEFDDWKDRQARRGALVPKFR